MSTGAAPDARARSRDYVAGLADLFVPMAIRVAARLGLAEHLRAGPLDTDTLADRAACNPEALRSLLRVLVSVGIVSLRQEGYGLTAAGGLLCADVEMSLHPWLTNETPRAVLAMQHTIVTGRPAFTETFGTEYFARLAADPDAAGCFWQDMHHASLYYYRDLPSTFPWADYRHVVDVGGGDGTLLAILLEGWPHLRGTLADVAEAEQWLCGEFRRLRGDRAVLAPCDFFTAIPTGGDVIVLARVLHDWDDTDAARILRACRATPQPAELLVIDHLLTAPASFDAALSDLEMLTLLGGRERDEQALGHLLVSEGYEPKSSWSLRSGLTVTHAVPR
jgi:hypothetical protein